MTAPRASSPRTKTEDPQIALYIMAVQRIEKTLSDHANLSETRHLQILKALGEEGLDERGQPIGTGILGRVMRLEGWRRTMDGWTRYGAGALASAVLFASALWWLTSEKLGQVLK